MAVDIDSGQSRILQSQQAKLLITAYVDNTTTDFDAAPAVTVKRDDTTTLTSGTATNEAGTGIYSFTLTPAQTASLDKLTVTWTGTIDGAAQTFTTRHEIVGGTLFTLADLQARLTDDQISTTFTAAQLAEGRARAEAALEDACSMAWVPRYLRKRYDGTGTTDLLIEHAPVTITAIRTRDRGGTWTSFTAGELALVDALDEGVLVRAATWPVGRGNVEVTYTHGVADAPLRVRQAALLLARELLVNGPISDRATRIELEGGVVEARLTPGIRGIVFGIPEVDAVIAQYGQHVTIA